MSKLGIYVNGEKTKLSLEEIEENIEKGLYDEKKVTLYTNHMMKDLMAERILEKIIKSN